NNCGGMQREHILLQANENTSGSITTDPTIGELHARKPRAEILAPSLRDRIAQQHHSTAILLDTRGPFCAPLPPKFAKPLLAANWPGARQTVISGRNLKVFCALRRWLVLGPECGLAEP